MTSPQIVNKGEIGVFIASVGTRKVCRLRQVSGDRQSKAVAYTYQYLTFPPVRHA